MGTGSTLEMDSRAATRCDERRPVPGAHRRMDLRPDDTAVPVNPYGGFSPCFAGQITVWRRKCNAKRYALFSQDGSFENASLRQAF